MRSFALVCVTLGVGACGVGETSRDQPQRELDGAVPDQRWIVAPNPIVDIGGSAADGHLMFEYPVGATRLSDGSIAVADGIGAAVRYFDPAGRLLRSVGRHGSGPGEFGLLSWLGQCGADSVFVWDFMQGRMTVLDGAGNVARQYRLPSGSDTRQPPATISCSRDGIFAFLSRPTELPPPRPGRRFARYRARLSIGDRNGMILTDIGDILAGEIAYAIGNWAPRPLGKFTLIAASGSHVFAATGDSGLVDVYDLSGGHTGYLSFPVPRRSPTRYHYDRAVATQAIWLADNDLRQNMSRRLSEIPMPELLPPYTTLVTSPDGNLWLSLSTPGDTMTWMRAISLGGEVLGDVLIPLNLTVFEVGEGFILGTYEDKEDEPHVAVYEMQRNH